MDPIKEGATGVAVEDIQERLSTLDYVIAKDELDSGSFGPSTANAVARFRLDHGFDLGKEIDAPTWAALVDEGYELGDRSLYLRLPNFHGRDVRQLQERLNILGFSCGNVDGLFGVYTEAALRQFQESIGELGDGMAFQDTFDAIERLRHVWAGKPADGPHPQGGMSFARAANVLENAHIAITGDDPISRNVAGRIWNLASATTEQSGVELVDSPSLLSDDIQACVILSATPRTGRGGNIARVSMDGSDTLPRRLRTAIQSSKRKIPAVRIELSVSNQLDGSFTTSDAQTYAVMLLDAICSAFEDM